VRRCSSIFRGRRFCTDSVNKNSSSTGYDGITVQQRDRVGILTINRPKVLNSLSEACVNEIVKALKSMETDRSIGAVVIAGTGKAFGTGADINELVGRSMYESAFQKRSGSWIDTVYKMRKPLIASVQGYALGGGCELALACDIVLASPDAQFGLPEIQLGTIPGFGGTQRLIRAVGKSKAMEMILTGRRMTAEEAESAGLVARIMPAASLLEEAITVASVIASHSSPVLELAKQCVNQAYEAPLSAGIAFERNAFYSTFALEDQKEGMAAFLDKRQPHWRHK